jgi:ribosomal protein S18 acetylase RimI-like enzyme
MFQGPRSRRPALTEETVAPMPDATLAGPAGPLDPPPAGDDALAALGLRPVELADAPLFRRYFATLAAPLSDYTFSQIYTWRNSLHLAWREIAGHLCVFANGCGDLTLLVPPIGDTGSDGALRDATELMDTYNAAAGVPDRTRVEYASDELLARLDPAGLAAVAPMGVDYVYDTARMIDLAGGDLASKRQARNRFVRLYPHRVEVYDPAKHLDACLGLLADWRSHQDAHHTAEPTTNSVKRQKETIATELALRSADALGLRGLVVYVEGLEAGSQSSEGAASSATSSLISNHSPLTSLRGFTLGEPLGGDQSSIVIEKTDLAAKGLAQFIFSEFCRRDWADRPFCNVGDDWGLESLAWTKQSYRPVRLLQKYSLVPARKRCMGYQPISSPAIGPVATQVRLATDADLTATEQLERSCFAADLSLKRRQLQYLRRRDTAVFLVAESAGQVIGEGIALVRRSGPAASGRIYSLAVDQGHRGRHVGEQLLTTMVDQLAARGVGRVYLEVDRTNAAAIALYRRLGFETTDTRVDYYGPGRDALHMRRDLRAAA